MEQTSKHSARIDEEISRQNAPILNGPPVHSRVDERFVEQEVPPDGSIDAANEYLNGEELSAEPELDDTVDVTDEAAHAHNVGTAMPGD
jgi:hypothetical protein